MNLSITACVVSIVLHELAHIATAMALGVRIKRMGLNWRGPYIVREAGTPLQNLCISLAGPTVNALLMLAPGLLLVNLALLVPNVILRGSDGRRAWGCWQAMASPEDLGTAR